MKNQSSILKFNMQGYLLQLDTAHHRWSWMKWEYISGKDGRKQVVRRQGGLEFMKMHPAFFPGYTQLNSPLASAYINRENDIALKQQGVEFVFLYQGETVIERDFDSIEAAESFYCLEDCPEWELTSYWFSYDEHIQSWGMYDVFTGDLSFTPAQAAERLKHQRTAVSFNKISLGITNRKNNGHLYH